MTASRKETEPVADPSGAFPGIAGSSAEGGEATEEGGEATEGRGSC